MKIYLAVRRDLDHMIAPYIARDSFYRTEFCFTMTDAERDEFLEGIIQKFIKLEEFVDFKIVPMRDYQACIKDGEIKDSVQYKSIKYKSDWQCLYCQYRSGCYYHELQSMEMILPIANSADELENSAE